jgi:hypothetical protein
MPCSLQLYPIFNFVIRVKGEGFLKQNGPQQGYPSLARYQYVHEFFRVLSVRVSIGLNASLLLFFAGSFTANLPLTREGRTD